MQAFLLKLLGGTLDWMYGLWNGLPWLLLLLTGWDGGTAARVAMQRIRHSLRK